MFLKKTGFPEEDELVLCTVTNIFHHGVFVNLDEYARSGMIHISEVSPGRIRNIRDFVQQGKKIVCKVLRINQEKGYIDLSLRRVNERQKKEKINEIKQEQKAEKIIEFAAKKHEIEPKKLYDEVAPKLLEKYGMLNPAFEDIVKGNLNLEKIGVDKKMAKALTELILERMKPTEVYVERELSLKSLAPDGVEAVRQALKQASLENITILYEGAGKYKVKAKANEYKDAEILLDKSTGAAIESIEKSGGEGSVAKAE